MARCPIQVLTDDLTIRAIHPNRSDYLWEIGSGANWLAYHVAVTLALQRVFLEQPNHPVPGIIIYDQPSQVYFPKLLVQRGGEGQPEPRFDRDEDVAAVHKAFAVLSRVVTAANGKLQALVLDHAPQTVWGDLPGIHLVEEWRDGRALVPVEWLQ